MFNLRALGLLFAFLAASTLAQDHSSEQSEAQISDPALECTPYYYAPSGQFVNDFPTTWGPATLLANDTEGNAMWANISSSIPTNIQPKGQPDGSTIGVTYDTANDPDCWWTETLCKTPKLAGLPPDVFNVPEPKTMGYGFDDGPNCTHNAFYNFLASQNQKATMYYVGSNVLNWPLEAQRAVVDGHEICVHTWSHRYMTALQSQDAFAELWYTMKAIKLATGVTPTCWRPPFGDVDDRIRAIANGLGLQTIMWEHDSFDWEAGVGSFGPADVDGNYWLFVNNLTAGNFDKVGGILLTHELNNFTMQEAINWYPKLKSTFSHIVPVGVALNKTQPYKESKYHLPTFEQYIAGQVTIPNTG
ncbi:carbohydrate esterase family 4 protein [Lactarius sanguifluus]|nr:carbohydrate esterase family 4 protein [Lactarius sanguifluus]